MTLSDKYSVLEIYSVLCVFNTPSVPLSLPCENAAEYFVRTEHAPPLSK